MKSFYNADRSNFGKSPILVPLWSEQLELLRIGTEDRAVPAPASRAMVCGVALGL